MHHNATQLIGYALGLGGVSSSSTLAPAVIEKSAELTQLGEKGFTLTWHEPITPNVIFENDKLSAVIDACHSLANKTLDAVRKNEFFTVIGGDHTCAMGTWSGVAHALREEGSLGLIWVDAHMDSHTPETSLTGNLHGMPLAALLGHGLPSLTQILDAEPKLKPENICLIGIRSFEQGEAALLSKLGVRIFFIEEVKQKGLREIFKEALQIVTKNTCKFGISIDIDSLDPKEAPGTGVPVTNGLMAADLMDGLKLIAQDPHLIGLEIAEFDPHFDKQQKTEKIIVNIIKTILTGKTN